MTQEAYYRCSKKFRDDIEDYVINKMKYCSNVLSCSLDSKQIDFFQCQYCNKEFCVKCLYHCQKCNIYFCCREDNTLSFCEDCNKNCCEHCYIEDVEICKKCMEYKQKLYNSLKKVKYK